MKTIFFDFARTIVQHPEDGAGLEIVKSYGVTDKNDMEIIRNSIFCVGKYLNNLDDGSLSRDEYRRLLREELPEHLGDIAVKAADYHMSMLPPIEGMKALLKKLKNDGFKLYITSNLDEYHSAQMSETEYADYFDGMFFSCEIGVRKPHKKFFEEALKKFNVRAEDCLFIDDLEENVLGARECNIKSFVFKGSAEEAESFIYG